MDISIVEIPQILQLNPKLFRSLDGTIVKSKYLYFFFRCLENGAFKLHLAVHQTLQTL